MREKVWRELLIFVNEMWGSECGWKLRWTATFTLGSVLVFIRILTISVAKTFSFFLLIAVKARTSSKLSHPHSDYLCVKTPLVKMYSAMITIANFFYFKVFSDFIMYVLCFFRRLLRYSYIQDSYCTCLLLYLILVLYNFSGIIESLN